MKIALLLTGDEILSGDLRESNSYYLIQQFSATGLRVEIITIIGDNPQTITTQIKNLAAKVDILIINGGLGPTTDDHTSECLAQAMNQDLVENKEALEQIKAIMQQKEVNLNQANLKQALLPRGTKPILNRVGSAPGIYAEIGFCRIYCTPGVPSELFIMFEEQIMPNINSKQKQIQTLIIRCFGAGESTLQEMITEQMDFTDDLVKLGFRAHFPYVDLKLTGNLTEHKRELQDKFKKLQQVAKLFSFSNQALSLGAKIVELLKKNNKTLVFAESCTGGMLSSQITAVPGSSAVFQAGYIVYNNQQKQSNLDVSAKALSGGAVSEKVVYEMLLGSLSKSGADLGAAISGIAGPEGGSLEKPVGTIWIAWGSKQKINTRLFYFTPRNRQQLQTLAANLGLDLLRREIENIPHLERYNFEKK